MWWSGCLALLVGHINMKDCPWGQCLDTFLYIFWSRVMTNSVNHSRDLQLLFKNSLCSKVLCAIDDRWIGQIPLKIYTWNQKSIPYLDSCLSPRFCPLAKGPQIKWGDHVWLSTSCWEPSVEAATLNSTVPLPTLSVHPTQALHFHTEGDTGETLSLSTNQLLGTASKKKSIATLAVLCVCI